MFQLSGTEALIIGKTKTLQLQPESVTSSACTLTHSSTLTTMPPPWSWLPWLTSGQHLCCHLQTCLSNMFQLSPVPNPTNQFMPQQRNVLWLTTHRQNASAGCFNRLPNIEQNAAHWQLVLQHIDYWITQKCAAIKKAMCNLYFSCSYAMLITLSGGL
jgi:hypothetical protein